MKLPAYVLITPARNEAQFIEQTLKSVIAQTVKPLKWLIVSDGSTDGTDEIVSRYTAQRPWIELLHLPERKERNFAGKVMAFNAGYAHAQDLPYEVIASLDADISLPDSDYFEFLLGKLADDPVLGLVGTPFEDNSISYDYRFVSIEHVSGACQVFRRQCFEQIGGYTPVKGGGIDHLAVLGARVKGWKTRTFTDKHSVHRRAMGTAEHGTLKARFRQGAKDYAFGYHPLWEFCRSVYQMTKAPVVVGGALTFFGYVWAALRRVDRPVTKEMMAMQRQEQMTRLKQFVLSRIGRPRSAEAVAPLPNQAAGAGGSASRQPRNYHLVMDRVQELQPGTASDERSESGQSNHISVCVCTFKRPELLNRLLDRLMLQETAGEFTYSLVVVDNDPGKSAETAISQFISRSPVETSYGVQAEQSIALTRNQAIQISRGAFIAFIDDDEFPADGWLLNLYRTCTPSDVAGVLGPVKRHFDKEPPKWILKGTFFDRPTHPTGWEMDWLHTRTGNVIFRRDVLPPNEPPFRKEFRGGSDVDFFRRAIARGFRFVWCNEAVVYETVPPARWKRSYMLRRALLRGRGAALRKEGLVSLLKSVVAVPLYALALPFAQLMGHHRFMVLLIKLCDHLGKILTLVGFNVVKDSYVTD